MTSSKSSRWSEHSIRRRVQFYETDAAGIVHFSCYFRYMEEAEHALWRAAGLSVVTTAAGVEFPRVAASFDFQKPLRFEDEFDILIRIVEIRDKVMRYACLMTLDAERVATGSMTIVSVQKTPDGLKAAPIPPEIAERFEIATENGA